jgi:hypothetical protein
LEIFGFFLYPQRISNFTIVCCPVRWIHRYHQAITPHNFPHYNRRDILRLAGLAAGAATFPAACRAATPTAESSNSTMTVSETTATQPEPVAARSGTSRVSWYAVTIVLQAPTKRSICSNLKESAAKLFF